MYAISGHLNGNNFLFSNKRVDFFSTPHHAGATDLPLPNFLFPRLGEPIQRNICTDWG